MFVKKVLFVTSTLPLVHGGRTKSILQRAKILSSAGFEVTILTTNYNANYGVVYKSLYEKDIVLRDVRMLNIYDELKPAKHQDRLKINSVNELGFEVVKHPDKNAYRLYKDDRHVFYKSYTLEGGGLRNVHEITSEVE